MVWGNRLTRICTWARLEDSPSGKSFYVYNLHLDNESQPSRERSVALLLDRIRQRDPAEPVLVMGDFNADEANPTIRAMTDSASPRLLDTFRAIHPDETEIATFHDKPAMTLRGTCVGLQKTYILPGRKVYE